MIRKPEMQIEHMEQANVRPGYSARRPMIMIELEESELNRKKNKKGTRTWQHDKTLKTVST